MLFFSYLCIPKDEIASNRANISIDIRMIQTRTRQKIVYLTLVVMGLVWMIPTTSFGQSSNARQAREMFERTFQMVFGPQGCSLHYDVNLVGLYKTKGSIWYKDEKSKFVESRYLAWNNGKNHYLVDTKKKTVTLFDAASDKKDKYSSNFKFDPDNYNYSVSSTDKGYLLTLKLKQGCKGMKLIKALIDKKSRAPISLKIKVAFFWAHVNISNFHSGGISDDIFIFPRKQYAGYELIDKRGE